ncbi:MAG: YceI family protein [Wenzhouxiangellaceae bacterium]|nr:YceI family protein [Wenzhouxiangellaceae bacterium]
MRIRDKTALRATQLAAVVAVLWLTGCAARPGPGDDTPDSAWPSLPDLAAATAYRIDASASELRAIVSPAGPMAGLGHHHVVGGAALHGTLHVFGGSPPRAFVDARVDVDALEVDRPAWRREEGLDPELEEDTVTGTRRNLLGPELLDAERHPHIEIRSAGAIGPGWQQDATLRLRIKGRIRELVVPVAVEQRGDRLVATGRLSVDHAELGLEPFSAAGGALRVAETIEIRFRVVARASPADVAMMRGGPHPPDAS